MLLLSLLLLSYQRYVSILISKTNKSSADPDIIDRPITPEDEFVVLACDGIWDVLTNQQVVDFVRSKIAKGLELDKICEQVSLFATCKICHPHTFFHFRYFEGGGKVPGP